MVVCHIAMPAIARRLTASGVRVVDRSPCPRRRQEAFLLLRAAALALLLPAGAAAAAPDPLGEFLAKNRCAVADRLGRLFDAGDPAQDRNRFIVIDLPERGYVQCLFHDRETMVLCEASSGFYETPAGQPRTARLPPEKVAALGRLGFSTDDSAGNFQRDTAVPASPDFGAMATWMLTALFEGYDARADDTLRFVAPFAPGLVLACDPLG